MKKISEIENRKNNEDAGAMTMNVKEKAKPSQKVTKPISEPVLSRSETSMPAEVKQKKPKNKRIVYVSESDSSESEEEVVIKKPKAKKSYQWTPEDIEDLKQKELEMRMKKMEERDEFVRMEKAMLQQRYAAKLKEVQRSQLAKYMFGGR